MKLTLDLLVVGGKEEDREAASRSLREPEEIRFDEIEYSRRLL